MVVPSQRFDNTWKLAVVEGGSTMVPTENWPNIGELSRWPRGLTLIATLIAMAGAVMANSAHSS